MADMLYKATKYMNAEDAMIARGGKPKKKERQEDHCQDTKKKETRRENTVLGVRGHWFKSKFCHLLMMLEKINYLTS